MKKKILFIAPRYFNYPEVICSQLRSLGYDVIMYQYDTSSFLYTVCSRIGLKRVFKSNLYNGICQAINKCSFDCVFVIKGDVFTANEWSSLMSMCKCRKYLYQWDSLKNFDYTDFKSSFDVVYTFDRNDSEKNPDLVYLPLFYVPTDLSNINVKYDLLFVGTWHSDRIQILNLISNLAKSSKLEVYFKIYYSFLIWLTLWIKGVKISSPFLTFKKISKAKMDQLYKQSRCIVDIAHPTQSGLTMRTIETIGMNKKLITTNRNIINEDFYTPDNILIINRECKSLDLSFLDKEGNYPNVERYAIENWLNRILEK